MILDNLNNAVKEVKKVNVSVNGSLIFFSSKKLKVVIILNEILESFKISLI